MGTNIPKEAFLRLLRRGTPLWVPKTSSLGSETPFLGWIPPNRGLNASWAARPILGVDFFVLGVNFFVLEHKNANFWGGNARFDAYLTHSGLQKERFLEQSRHSGGVKTRVRGRDATILRLKKIKANEFGD